MSYRPDTVKPLIASSIDRGGAAIAARRLHHAYLQQGIPSSFVVGRKTGDDTTIIDLPATLTPLEQWRYRRVFKHNIYLDNEAKRTGAIKWSDNRRWHTLPWHLNRQKADVLHLHWIGDGFLPIGMLRYLTKPIIWTMHDNWGYTGGCHIHLDCHQYRDGCGHCPQLNSSDLRDASFDGYRAKLSAWQTLNLTVITPSHWLGQQFQQSPIFANHRVEVIPNAIHLDTFKHLEKAAARTALSLPPDASYLVFGAFVLQDRNKGGDLLIQALEHLAAQDQSFTILLIGTEQARLPFPDAFDVHRMGFVDDEPTLNQIYAAADVCVVPSRQENLSNTIMESLASGTPVVAFDACGNPDLISHRQHGYLAQPYEPADLARGIQWAFEHSVLAGMRGRQYVEKNYAAADIVRKHLTLYHEVLNPSH